VSVFQGDATAVVTSEYGDFFASDGPALNRGFQVAASPARRSASAWRAVSHVSTGVALSTRAARHEQDVGVGRPERRSPLSPTLSPAGGEGDMCGPGFGGLSHAGMEEDVVPGLEAIGFPEASAAWQQFRSTLK